MDSFANKVVIVTGSSSGIGAETAVRFAGQGAKVVVTGRNEERLAATREACRQAGATDDKILVVVADLAKQDDISRLVQVAVDTFDRIDVLVNNAGQSCVPTKFLDTTLEDLMRIFNVNTTSAFSLTQVAMPYLIKSRGNVVNVSSVCGCTSMSKFLPYSISKAALDQLTKCLALEFANQGVRINSVNPGHVKTPIYINAGMTDAVGEAELLGTLATVYPMERIGEVGEVAEAILFLASNKASFTTGMLLTVDGGITNCTALEPLCG